METEKKIMGRCPFCGGNVVKTCKGYRCEHNIGEQSSCALNINSIIGNRKMEDNEIVRLLEERFLLLDDFASKEGKSFPTVIELADDGAINMRPVIGKCLGRTQRYPVNIYNLYRNLYKTKRQTA